MKKVCVVGGAGYVGSALCRRLMEHGLEVHCFDILLYGDKGVVPPRSSSVRDRPPGGAYFFSPLDARQINPGALEGFDTVFNLAGFSNDPTAEFRPALNWDLNVTAAARVAEAARDAGVDRLVYASSASIYHSSSYEIDAEIGESFKVAPHWHYSASKYAGELASLAFNRPGFDVVALRKGTVCGPSHRMRYDLMVNTMFRSAMRDKVIFLHGGGCMYRPLLSLWDAVEAYIAVAAAPRQLVSGEVFNVVSENALVRDYAEIVRAHVENSYRFSVMVSPTDQRTIARSYRVSARKLMERLGWSPAGKCNEVVASLVNAYDAGWLPAWDDPSTENITMMKEGKCECSYLAGGVNSAVLSLKNAPPAALSVSNLATT